MKVFKTMVVFSLFSVFVHAQPVGDIGTNGDDPNPDGLINALGGANHSCFIQLGQSAETVAVDIMIENLAGRQINLILVGHTLTGDGFYAHYKVMAGAVLNLPADELSNVREIYILSIDPFRVNSSAPVLEVSQFTTRPSVAYPRYALMKRTILLPNGEAGIVIIDGNDVAHYPIYGIELGDYDPQTGEITTVDGETYIVRP